jgi:hypothetical protein
MDLLDGEAVETNHAGTCGRLTFGLLAEALYWYRINLWMAACLRERKW